jgi:tryptophan-rich sensory protein
MRKPLLALLDISLLTPCAFLLTSKAYQVDPRTAYCLVPYCAWLSYATYLNGQFACSPSQDTFLASGRQSCRTRTLCPRRSGN